MITRKLQFLLGKKTLMVAFWPLIILKKGYNPAPEEINHEKIHHQQQKEMLIFGFIIWYFAEFLIHYIRYRNFMKAYMSISFEKEAYSNQNNLNYLKDRKTFSYKFIKYL